MQVKIWFDITGHVEGFFPDGSPVLVFPVSGMYNDIGPYMQSEYPCVAYN